MSGFVLPRIIATASTGYVIALIVFATTGMYDWQVCVGLASAAVAAGWMSHAMAAEVRHETDQRRNRRRAVLAYQRYLNACDDNAA
jgi:hypothetical protein